MSSTAAIIGATTEPDDGSFREAIVEAGRVFGSLISYIGDAWASGGTSRMVIAIIAIIVLTVTAGQLRLRRLNRRFPPTPAESLRSPGRHYGYASGSSGTDSHDAAVVASLDSRDSGGRGHDSGDSHSGWSSSDSYSSSDSSSSSSSD